MNKKQITLNVNGDKIKITATGRTYLQNPCGYNVKVNDKKYYFNVLTYSEAIELGYIKYIKENR